VAEYTHGIRLPLAPFLGVMGVEPAGDQQTSAILAGSYGGNLVLRDLTAGASLFLPVAKPGARVWIGDVHALQGDGVVQLPRHPVRPPDSLGLQLSAAEGRARRDHQGHLPR
jgi:acetamidase/formamidase